MRQAVPQRQRGRKPSYQTDIAKERIDILLNLAKKEQGKNPVRSRRYVQLAQKIGMRYNVRLGQVVKRSFCKKCGTIYAMARKVNSLEDEGTRTVECPFCHAKRRIPPKERL